MDFTIKDNSLIICPNQTKTKILKELSQTKKLVNIKFMTKEEYKKIYYFSYDDKSLAYLIKKYNYNIDVARVYINNLYAIDENKTYKSPKLNFLKDLKKELIREGLLIYNNTYKEYLKTKNIIVKNEYNLEKYEEEMLGIKEEHVPEKTITAPVMECNTLEEEVNQVCLEIINLLKKGADINKIYLTNVSTDYLYTIKSLFSFYHIPININFNYSIYSTKVVKDYLNTKELDLENKDKKSINKKLINILSDLSFLDENSKEYKILLTDKLKNTFTSPVNLKNAITIKDLYKESFNDDEYVFVLGFNQDELPKMEKDISYITDKEKDEVSLYKTDYLNKRNKNNLVYILSNIKNLYLSYKLTSPFKSYYKSSLITDLSLNIVKPKLDSYNSSNIYNELRLASYLDLYHLYGEKNKDLSKLYTHYQIPYKTYSNVFTGINNDEYLTNLPYPLKLSYTSLNAYSECKFKYYIRHVLKLEPYTDTFQTYIGSMYHYILSVYKKTNFNFEEEYQKYLEKRDLSLKEKLLLIRIKKDLLKLIDILNKQDLITGYNDAYYEKKIDIDLKKKVSVIFTGSIDKIMYYQNIEDTYFSIIDYKTGSIDTHIEPMKYGLHMQLPVYLYLIHYSKAIKSPIFTGIYYQNILFNYPTWSKDIEKVKKDQYLLQGYSTDDISILSRFDSTYEKSEYIKSMSYNEEKGFGTYATKKVLSNDTLYDLLDYTKNYISKETDNILSADFTINPKVYSNVNISCAFCSFKDICYMKEKDLVYLEKQNDLSFLGGDK
ncbi:MAG: PD-(D/E)XK nuclease family protein [Bacilli bacterium]|nr:PD-(D/E)XK nuclease family protein [Mycoplasmatota bacterium]MEE0014730.1 PD-(D/E)XK nuclease family protein [Bacilli bacterium]